MNKAELVKALEERLGSRKAAQEALEVVLDTIVREVAKGGRVAITGFGTFEKSARAARTGRNPRTGEVVKIKKTSVPRFKAGTSFKGYVADPRSLPKAAPAAARAAAGTMSSVARTASGTAYSIAESALQGGKKAKKPAPTQKASTTKKATPAKKTSTTKKTTPAKKSTATKSTATKSAPAKKAATTKKATPAKKTSTAKKSTAKKTASSGN